MTGGATPQTASELLARSLVDEFDSLSLRRDTRLNQACAHLLSTHGKLLRGRLVFAAARQGHAPEAAGVRQMALAVELLHLASLAHDDIIDSGATRRGVPTAGKLFGQHAAGFAGGWIFARSTEIVAEYAPEQLGEYAKTALEVCEGGMRELRSLYDTSRSVKDYFSASSQKTASVFSLAIRGGAEIAGAPAEAVSMAEKFARDFGIAWQIWDDLTDLVAGADLSGKAAVTDLRHGVFTLPVIFAMEESEDLREQLMNVRMTASEHEIAVATVKRTAGIERAAKVAREHATQAKASIDTLPDSQALSDLLEGALPRHLDEFK